MRCHAKSKRSQEQCKSWAVKGKKVCRMHGAFSGVKPKHGLYTAKAIEEKKMVKAIIDSAKNTLR
jgi:hypothetical protein